MKEPTTKELIEKILLTQGYIDNYYVLDKRLTVRLGAYIHLLSQEGWQFDEEKSGYIGDTKNWRYVVKKSPYQVQRRTLSNGEVLETLVR